MSKLTIHTVGYRGKDKDQVLGAANLASRSSIVVDVRASRPTRGVLCGQGLRHWLQQNWHEYLWLPLLGNPKKKLPWDPPSRVAAEAVMISLATQVADGMTIVLMCACAKAESCHRTEVAEAIAELVPGGCEIVHL